MPTVTLLARGYIEPQLQAVDYFLRSALEGLKVEAKIRGLTSRGWIQVTVTGEDERIALNYLAKEIGLCPTLLTSLSKFMTTKGRIAAIGSDELSVDVGIFSPCIVDATVSADSLRVQLADGKEIPTNRLTELFGLHKDLPLTVKILNVDEQKKRIEAMVAEKQLDQFRKWLGSLLDRLIVLGVPVSDVESAIEMAECDRDILEIESLGLFEHALVCKLGTDAAGLMPKIGKELRRAVFTVFNPRKVIETLKDSWACPTLQ